MKKTQYQILQEILQNNKDVPPQVLNEGILTALVKGAKAIGKFARKVFQNSKPRTVSTKKVEPRITKPLKPKARKAPDKKSIQKVKPIPDSTGKIPYVKGMGIQTPLNKTQAVPDVVDYKPGVASLKTTYFDYLTRRFSKGRINKQMSKTIQDYFGWKFVDLMEKDFSQWDAYKLGIIDASGNELRKAKNSQERDAWNYFIKAVATLRQNLYTMIPSQPRINYMLRNLQMVKESKSIDHHEKYLHTIELLMNEVQPLVEQYIDDIVDGRTINTLTENTNQENPNG